MLPEQHVHHLPVLVDRPVEVVLVLAPEEEHFVDVALLAERAAVLADLGCQERPEGLHPPQHRALTDIDPPLSEQLHDARGGEWVAQ